MNPHRESESAMTELDQFKKTLAALEATLDEADRLSEQTDASVRRLLKVSHELDDTKYKLQTAIAKTKERLLSLVRAA